MSMAVAHANPFQNTTKSKYYGAQIASLQSLRSAITTRALPIALTCALKQY